MTTILNHNYNNSSIIQQQQPSTTSIPTTLTPTSTTTTPLNINSDIIKKLFLKLDPMSYFLSKIKMHYQ
jgi:hypothetical protein